MHLRRRIRSPPTGTEPALPHSTAEPTLATETRERLHIIHTKKFLQNDTENIGSTIEWGYLIAIEF